ncbi:MAG: hemolysin family protein [Treponema sp.]|jgi:putative hemolysin|nr:hemolysin family protein [Treponema sp.]
MDPYPEFLGVFLLIIASGIFSLFDCAFTACRKTRLEKETGKSYRSVLKAQENPRKLLLACRLWINIFRIFAAFLSGMIIVRILETLKTGQQTSAFIIAVSVLSLGSVAALLGDALPKLFSTLAPEKITALLLPLMKVFCTILMPVILPAVKFGSFFRSVFRLETNENSMTEDELRNALLEGEKSGIVESRERTMVEGVFYLGDRAIGAFMTHRSEIHWFDVNSPYDEVKAKALEHRQQRCFPVVNGNPDEIIGEVYLEDIVIDSSLENPRGLRAIMKKAYFIPETMTALSAFESFRQGQANFLFVMDEYGGLAGVISIRALVEEIVGELSAPLRKERGFIKQEDGTLLADGALNIDDAVKFLSLTGINEDGDFHTLAGFILNLAGELPRAGDSYEYQGYRFIVKEMDGNRIDKLFVSKIE